ncbi:MAG TPA: SRPBCC family protein [Microthrixaceae bacterium]|nr:SRPBCC family protein [Microthrixaceae bacterium]
MSGSDKAVSVSRVIKADPQRIFDVLADPTLHHVIDGSGTVRHAAGPSRKLALGDKFATNMRLFVPYRMTNKVVEYAEGSLIAWAHIGGWRWRYELEPITEGDDAGATRVTETFDWSTSKAGFYVTTVGWPKKNLDGMTKTLSRLDAFVTNTNSAL